MPVQASEHGSQYLLLVSSSHRRRNITHEETAGKAQTSRMTNTMTNTSVLFSSLLILNFREENRILNNKFGIFLLMLLGGNRKHRTL